LKRNNLFVAICGVWCPTTTKENHLIKTPAPTTTTKLSSKSMHVAETRTNSMYMDNGKCKETCGGDSCLYDRSVIIMFLSAVILQYVFLWERGEKKKPQ
jgi:hypothetical protein